MDPAPLRAQDPQVVGPYRLLGRLGEGGMGVVYLARSPSGADVAVKVVHPRFAADPGYRARFRTEAAAAARVVGFWTARVLDGDTEAPAPYLVTEHVPGPSLEAAVATSGPLPARDVEAFAAGVATALVAIHRAGVVHRDLKPSNVILSPSGPRVIDFGIARPLLPAVADPAGAAGHTRVGEVVGSPGWMAPEQLRQEPVGPAADVFAWAGLVLFAATGRPPFGTGPPAVVAYRVLSGAGPAGADVAVLPAGLRALVERSLALDPGWRPPAEVVLSALLEAVPAAATPSPPTLAAAPVPPTVAAAPVPPTAVGAPSRPGPRPLPLPRPAVPRRRRLRRRLAVGAAGTAGVVLLVGALGDREGRDPGASGSGTARSPRPSAAATPSVRATPRATRPAATVRDGEVDFAVRRVRCGLRRLGDGVLARDAGPDRQFCLVDVGLRNRGPGRHLLPPQRLVLDDGSTVFSDGIAALLVRRRAVELATLAPGERLEGTLVFDVPRRARPAQLELAGDVLSGGTRRRVP